MSADVAEALRRLRDADPAADLADEQWIGSAAEARTRHRDAGRLPLDAAAPALRLTRRWPAVLAAAAVVAGTSVAAVELSGGHSPSRRPLAAPSGTVSQSRPAPPVTTPPPAPAGTDPHKLEAERFVRHLLNQAPVLPGAQRRATAPTKELRGASGRIGNPVEHDEWFAAPGSMDEAVAYLRAHVPNGMKFGGTGTGARYGVVTSKSVHYTARDTGNLRDPEMWIVVAPYHGGVGVRVEAEAFWTASRPPGYLIEDATSATVTVRRGEPHPDPRIAHARTVRRDLSGPIVGKLVRVVNGLQPGVQVQRTCTWVYPRFDDSLVFATPTGSVRVFATLTGCSTVTISLADGRELKLDPGGLDAAVLHALGLPSRYGRH